VFGLCVEGLAEDLIGDDGASLTLYSLEDCASLLYGSKGFYCFLPRDAL